MYRIIKISLLLLLIISVQGLFGQVSPDKIPNGIAIQSVARDANGNAASNRNIYLKVELRQGTATGESVLLETHQVTSNDEGIFNFYIGQGTRVSGVNSLIFLDWKGKIYFLNIKMAIEPSLPTPGWVLDKEYVDLGTSQIWSVPYAFSSYRSVTADSAFSIAGILPGVNGGTGVNNAGKTITLGRNFELQGFGDLKFNTAGPTSLILPQKGTLVSKDGFDTLSNKFILSPLLLGVPKTPTADSTSSDSTVANTKFVQNSITTQIGFLRNQLNNRIDTTSGLRLLITDTAAMLSNRFARDTASLSSRINILNTKLVGSPGDPNSGYLKIGDTSIMLTNRIGRDTVSLSNRINLKVNTLNATIDSSLFVNGKVRIDSVLTVNDSLRVKGNVLVDSNLTIKGKLSINGGFDFRDSLTVTRGARIDSSLTLKGKLFLTDSLLANGNAKINNNLLVNQKTRLNDSLTVMGVTRLNDSLTVNGRTRINDSLLVRGNVMIDKDLIVKGKLSINGGFDFQDSLTVTRGARIDSSLLLKGKLLLIDSLLANGNAKINNNLLVTGNTNTGTLSSTRTDAGILAAGNTTITGTLSTTGVATIGDNLVVTNNTKTGTLSVTGATTLTGATTISSTLSVADATTLNNGLTVSGNTKTGTLSVTGAVTVDGNVLVKGLNVSDSIAKFSVTKLNAADTASLSNRIGTLSTGSNKFTADLKVNFGGGSFGKYTDKQIIPAAGKTIDEVFADILTTIIHPTYAPPTASLSITSSNSIASGNVEIGANLGTLTLVPTFTQNRGGASTGIVYKKGGATIASTDVPAALTSSISYSVTYTYAAGTSVQQNNIGQDDVVNQVTAGSVTTNTVTYTPASYKYWGVSTNPSASITDADIINKSVPAEGGGKEFATSKSKSSFTITGPGGAGPVKYAFYAFPTSTPGATISSILAGGFESIAAFDHITRTFRNASGYDLSYEIYVQKNSGTDNVTLIIN